MLGRYPAASLSDTRVVKETMDVLFYFQIAAGPHVLAMCKRNHSTLAPAYLAFSGVLKNSPSASAFLPASTNLVPD